MPAFGKRRALGQHFLRDTTVTRLIAETVAAEADRHGCRALLEIGPGKGAITEPILEELAKLEGRITKFGLSEADRDLAAFWRHRGGAARDIAKTDVEIWEGDFLQLPPAQWLGIQPLAVASNLPYSSGTAILVRLAEHPEAIPVMVLMFQAEVAQRLRAEPSTKPWGSLSVWVQNQWDVRKLCAVPPRAFAPPPDVDSEVVVLTRRETQRIAVGADPKAQALWNSLLKSAFAHRRKMLRGGLPAGSIPRKALDLSGVDGTKRAEALSWDEWRSLYEACQRIQG